jgi:hypothetical protein
MDVSLEAAYAEACKTIGEQAVSIRLLQRELARLQAPQPAADEQQSTR